MITLQGLLETGVLRGDYDDALAALAVWLRFSAARLLTWNSNYNVKPREISAAQVCSASMHRVTQKLLSLFSSPLKENCPAPLHLLLWSKYSSFLSVGVDIINGKYISLLMLKTCQDCLSF